MGKATRWLKRFLGIKTDSSQPHLQSLEKTTTSCFPEPKHQSKSKWKNVDKSCRQNGRASTDDGLTGRREGSADVKSEPRAGDAVVDRRKQAIVVPAETSAVVQKASETANPSGGERCGVSLGADFRIRKQWAAVTIQSHFRGYLARRARRALKGLVKLQALVRGNMVRKHTADMMARLEALLRAQARARVGRSQSLQLQYSFSKSSSQFDSHTQDPSTPENFELAISKRKTISFLKRSGSKSKPIILDMEQLTTEPDEGGGSNSKSNRTFDKEKFDSPKPSFPSSLSSSNRKSPMKPYDRSNSSDQYSRIFTTSVESTACHSAQSASSFEVQSLTPMKFLLYPPTEDNHLREPVTPTRSINSLRSASTHHPSYMSGTQSSRAKTRSISAPKLRPGLERSTSTTKRVLSLHTAAAADQTKPFSQGNNFAKKAYPGSGQLDPLGMPYYVSEF